jgi:hypothetical protein
MPLAKANFRPAGRKASGIERRDQQRISHSQMKANPKGRVPTGGSPHEIAGKL